MDLWIPPLCLPVPEKLNFYDCVLLTKKLIVPYRISRFKPTGSILMSIFFFVKEEMNVKFPVTKLSFTLFHLSMVPLLQYSTFCTFATFSSKYYPIYVSPVLGLSLLCFCPPARLFAASRIRHLVNKLQRTKVWKVDGFIRGKITHKFSTRDYHHSFTRRKTKIFPLFHDVPPNFQHKYNSFN